MRPPLPDGAPRTSAQLLAAQATQNPEGTFLITEDERVSWQAMWQRTERVAGGLSGLHIGAGDTVVLAMGNRIEFLETWLGVASIGGIEVPVNPDLVGARLVFLLNHSRARVAVVEPEMAARIDVLAPQLDHLEHVVVVGDSAPTVIPSSAFADLRTADAHGAAPYPGDESQLSAILYTSGSTGPPKGVMVPNGQHLANARQGAAAADLCADDVLYLCLPLHHNMAQGYGIMPALLTGCAVRLAPKFDRSRFWADVCACDATVWVFVGGLLALLDDLPPGEHDADNALRVAYGVPIPARLHRPFQDRFGLTLVHGYGSTEVTIPVWSDASCPAGAAGKVLSDYQVRVLDENDREVPAGTVGQISVRPERPYIMFAGYFHDADRTVAAWRNLWAHTGDRGSFDASGYLWFHGRVGDAIRRFGEFIDAEEIEDAALAHDAILQAACVGVPDPVAGQEVLLSVALRQDAQLSPIEVRQWLEQRVPPYARPRYISIDTAVPLTPTGKVERYKVRERGIPPTAYDFLKKESAFT